MSTLIWLNDVNKKVVSTVRPSQVEMARIIEKIINEGGIAAIEAGTGVGKTYGYLTPAILSGYRVLISTAKKTLQSQLYFKDLPHLTKHLDPNLSYALLKGKTNYVCPLRFEEFLNGSEVNKYQESTVEHFKAWLKIHKSGDFEMYPFAEEIFFGSHIKITECVRSVCPKAYQCGYQRNKTLASKAKLLIINHALLAYHLFIGGGRLLGDFDIVIIDEAHQAPKFFREAYTISMFPKQVEYLEKQLATDLRIKMPSAIKNIYEHIFSRLPKTNAQLELTPSLEAPFNDLLREWMKLRDQFQSLNLMPEESEDLNKELVPLPEEGDLEKIKEHFEKLDLNKAKNQSKITMAASFVLNQLNLCSIVLGDQPKELGLDVAGVEYVAMTEYKDKDSGYHHFELKTKPVDTGPLIAPALLGLGKVVLTSATLTTTRGSWGYMSKEFGIPSAKFAEKVILDSPFNYKANSNLFISKEAHPWETADKPHLKKYYETQAKEMKDLITASKGGAFIICASRTDMNAYYDILKNETGPYNVMKQSENNVDQDLQNFLTTPNAVLIGVQGIGEGVDIPTTKKLRLVIIPRFPFLPQDDVITKIQADRIKQNVLEDGGSLLQAEVKAFQVLGFPEMMLKLKQWAGRLIRTENDRGVVAILDTRALPIQLPGTKVKGYAKTLRESLPHPVTYEKESVLRFLRVLSTH